MTPRRYMETLRLPLGAGLAMLLAACAGAPVATPVPAAVPAAVPEIRPGVPAGYLDRSTIPDSQALVPAPPATGSAGLAQDHAVMQAALALRGTPRFEQARLDADLDFPLPPAPSPARWVLRSTHSPPRPPTGCCGGP